MTFAHNKEEEAANVVTDSSLGVTKLIAFRIQKKIGKVSRRIRILCKLT